MIFIVVKFPVRPEHADAWMDRVAGFTDATRAEPGNLWFDWSRGVEDPNEFVLIEAFRDAEAGAAHVTSEHFQRVVEELGNYLSAVARIVNVEVPGAEWSELTEIVVPDGR
jgi:quinol monooxygenase YgiN